MKSGEVGGGDSESSRKWGSGKRALEKPTNQPRERKGMV